MGINFAIGPLVGHLRQPELFKNTQKQACKKISNSCPDVKQYKKINS